MYIHCYILETNERAEYGAALYEKLSKKFHIGRRVLYRSVKFYKTYPEKLSARTISNHLTWTHFRILSTANSTVKRKKFERLVLKENLSVRELEKRIKVDVNDSTNVTNNTRKIRLTRIAWVQLIFLAEIWME